VKAAAVDPQYMMRAMAGCVPVLGDDPQPWEYRGWLLWVVQLIHGAHPEVPDRWGYLAECICDEKLPDQPIPHVQFHKSPEGEKCLDQWLKLVDDRRGWGWESFRTVMDWLAWGLGVADEQPDVDSEEAERLYRGIDLDPWLLSPYDYFGGYIAERKGRGWQNSTSFYPTPHEVVQLMVEMNFTGDEDYRAKSVLDCCAGTGRMLLHASNYSLRLSAVDIDPLVLQALRINGALYAPWLVAPIPWLEEECAVEPVEDAIEAEYEPTPMTSEESGRARLARVVKKRRTKKIHRDQLDMFGGEEE